jgi:E3 ubiquitin-protein ligase HUWE1
VRQDSKICDNDVKQQLTKLEIIPLSELLDLDSLWNTLSECLKELEETYDHQAVLVLQPAVEAFFIVHLAPLQNKASSASHKRLSPMDTTQSSEGSTASNDQPQASMSNGRHQQQQQVPVPQLSADQKKFLHFAETHRVALTQILRQSTAHLENDSFAMLGDHTRVLGFDVKRRTWAEFYVNSSRVIGKIF